MSVCAQSQGATVAFSTDSGSTWDVVGEITNIDPVIEGSRAEVDATALQDTIMTTCLGIKKYSNIVISGYHKITDDGQDALQVAWLADSANQKIKFELLDGTTTNSLWTFDVKVMRVKRLGSGQIDTQRSFEAEFVVNSDVTYVAAT